MGQQDEVRYGERTVDDWVTGAWRREIAVTDFQRSFVWEPARTAKYIKAILQGKPVGLYLILDVANDPQFEPRPFKDFGDNFSEDKDSVRELVLDGQQRLTSLLHAFYGHPRYRFFVQVGDLSTEALEPVGVVAVNKMTTRGRQLDVPTRAYREKLIPIDILRRRERDEDISPLAAWCADIADGSEDITGYRDVILLQEKITQFAERRLFGRRIYCCWLPASTSRGEAVDVFVDTNKSSVRITTFDEEVASARGRHNADLRQRIQLAYSKSDMLKHYFSEDPEDWIPEIGEWMLKVACLHAGFPPKQGHYGEAVSYLFDFEVANSGSSNGRLEQVFKDLDWALRRVAALGAPTRSLLPSWPPVHVLAALRARFLSLSDPADKNVARAVLTAYYWRSLFSDRHAARANDRLYRDFIDLNNVLDDVNEEWRVPAAFSNEEHPLVESRRLLGQAKWIGSSNRLGRAVASVVLGGQDTPVDWMSGEALDRLPSRIWRLPETSIDTISFRKSYWRVLALRGIRSTTA